MSSEGIQNDPGTVQTILDSNKVGDPVYDFFSQHKAIEEPSAKSITALRWDINRMDGVYSTDGLNVSSKIREEIGSSREQSLRDNTTVKYLMPEKEIGKNGEYDNFTKERIQKMQGLCQDIGNSSAIVFARNFCLKVDTEGGVIDAYGDMKGKETQNLIKLDDSTYRYDYEAVQYYCIVNIKENDYVFARRIDGEIITIDLGSTTQFKDGKINPDGSMTINDNGQEVTLLPLLKTNTSATLSFDDQNNPSVVLEYDFTGYTDKLTYDNYSNIAKNKVDGLEISIQKNENLNESARRNSMVNRLRRNDDDSNFSVVPSIRSFPAINNQKVQEGLQLLEKLARYLELGNSMTELNNLRVLKNKTPAKEMNAYQNFFNAWKEKYANNKEMLKFVQDWQVKIMTSGFSEQDRTIQLGAMMGEFRNKIESQNKAKLSRSKQELPPLPSSPSHHGAVPVTSSSSEASSDYSSTSSRESSIDDSLSVTSSSSSSNSNLSSKDDVIKKDDFDNKLFFNGPNKKDEEKFKRKFLFFGGSKEEKEKSKANNKKNDNNNNRIS